MKEYLFYYHETDESKTGGNGSFIWYSSITAESLVEAIEIFEGVSAKADKIIQVIVKGNLN